MICGLNEFFIQASGTPETQMTFSDPGKISEVCFSGEGPSGIKPFRKQSAEREAETLFQTGSPLFWYPGLTARIRH